MEMVKNIGLIENCMTGQTFSLAGLSRKEGYHLKKIFIGNNNSDTWVKQRYPGTEIVGDMQSIIHDANIDLVIIPAHQKEELNLVAEILQTGKNIRIL